MAEKALIYIPDISGFTKFVTQTEISHSNHIITELIEIIINANDLNLQISEIEGDAVLYYKFGELPTLNEIILQSKKMFLEFHKHLKIIERDNVCQCGACQSASNLGLKFITHVGEITEVAIKNFKKLMGRDVILAHSLLKSNLDFPEYLLLSSNYLDTQIQRDEIEEWVEFQLYTKTFEDFGEVKLEVVPFGGLKDQIPPFPENNLSFANRLKPDASVEINAPILTVHEILIDNELKLKWVPGIKKIESDSPINKINSSHTCVFDDLEIHFVTLFNKREGIEINYSEAGELNSGLSFVSDYKLVEENEITTLSLNIIPGKIADKNLGVIKKLFLSIKLLVIVFVSRRSSQKNLNKFKEFAESYSVG